MRTFTVDPVVRLHYVEVTPPELASPTRRPRAGCSRRSSASGSLTGLEADLEVIRGLQPALEPGKYGVTVAVHDGRQVIAVWPGLHETAYGVAIDIGSTTIAGHLANLADGAVLASNGVMNPQIRFGEDLMSRVSYAMMHPEGAGEMTARRAQGARRADRVAGDAGRDQAGARSSSSRSSATRSCTTSCSASTRRRSAARRSRWPPTGRSATTAAELGLRAHPGARVYVLPCIAGHVGRRHGRGDPGRGAAPGRAADPGRRRRHQRRDRAGRPAPAAGRLEPDRPGLRGRPDQRRPAGRAGRHRAGPDRPRHARAALPGHRRRRLVGRARRSPTAVAETGITGICGSGIIEVVAELFLAGVVTADGVIDGGLAARTPRIVPDGRTFSYVLHDGRRPAARGSPSPRTTSGRSSWPRPRCTRASGC